MKLNKYVVRQKDENKYILMNFTGKTLERVGEKVCKF